MPKARRKRLVVRKAQNSPMADPAAPLKNAAPPEAPPEEETTDTNLEVDDLDLDIQGAMYELTEFAGLCGDEEADPLFEQLPKEVQLAMHTIGGWAGFDQGAEAEPPPPSTAQATGQAAVAARLQKDAGPDATDVAAPMMINQQSTAGKVGKHLVKDHGMPAGKVGNMAPHQVVAIHNAAHAKGGADHTHAAPEAAAPEAIAKAEDGVVWVDKAEDKQIVYSVVLHPGGADYHGDEYPVEEIEKAAHHFMANLQRQQIEKGMHTDMHQRPAEADVIESYITPQDFRVEDPNGKEHLLLKGSWVIGSQINDAKLWTSIVKGERGGVSIEGMALRYAA